MWVVVRDLSADSRWRLVHLCRPLFHLTAAVFACSCRRKCDGTTQPHKMSGARKRAFHVFRRHLVRWWPGMEAWSGRPLAAGMEHPTR